MEKMTFFTDLTTSLKQKWVEYFHINRAWIAREMEVESVETPDGGRRPSSYLILGVVSVLEPQLAQLLTPFTKLNPDINALIDVLELNFDPEKFQGDPSNPAQRPHSNPTENPEANMDVLMGLTADEDESSNTQSRVEIVDHTEQESFQQESLDQPSPVQDARDDAWMDEWNKGAAEQKPDNTSDRQEKRSPEDEEISRLFPDF